VIDKGYKKTTNNKGIMCKSDDFNKRRDDRRTVRDEMSEITKRTKRRTG